MLNGNLSVKEIKQIPKTIHKQLKTKHADLAKKIKVIQKDPFRVIKKEINEYEKNVFISSQFPTTRELALFLQ